MADITDVDIEIRDLTTIDEFRQVVALEQAIWGYTDLGDIVTVPVFIFTVHRGATLLGAFDAGRPHGGFRVWRGRHEGRPRRCSGRTWPACCRSIRGGLGYQLKLAQRQRALAQGLDLIEWTFDPLQAMNAHFNFAKLGGVSDEYAVNFYGESTSALHRGTPTDRLVASWRISEPHVVRRLEQPAALRARAHDVADAPVVNHTELEGEWRVVRSIDLTRDDRRVWIEIPTGFTDMQQQAPELALRWRLRRAADVRGVFCEGLPRRRFPAAARRGVRPLSAWRNLKSEICDLQSER